MEDEAVLKEIEELSKKSFLPIIGPIKGNYLVDTVKRFDVKKVMEVGTLVGYSSILIAKNLPEEGKVITIEIDSERAKQSVDNIKKAGFADKIQIYTGNALEIIPGLQDTFDMIFLDASKNEYLDYLELAESKLKKGQPVFADNVKKAAHEMQDYLEYVRNSGKFKSEYIDVGFDGVEISIKLF